MIYSQRIKNCKFIKMFDTRVGDYYTTDCDIDDFKITFT